MKTLEQGICPVCNGTGRRPAGDYQYKHVVAGYDKGTDTLACNNCGGQTMFGSPTGLVPINKHGVPCTHKYVGKTVGRCLTEYTCTECNSRYQIDSGD